MQLGLRIVGQRCSGGLVQALVVTSCRCSDLQTGTLASYSACMRHSALRMPSPNTAFSSVRTLFC